MAKIAVEFEPHSRCGVEEAAPARRVLAQGDGWSISDVVCRAGPRDRPFEEQHSRVGIGIVVEGTFQYQAAGGRELMTPGSLLLGNAGQYFQCGHEHGVGDRCISFLYEPEYFENLLSEAQVRSRAEGFSALRVPPLRESSRLVARACAELARSHDSAIERNQPITEGKSLTIAGNLRRDAGQWEELAIELSGLAVELATTRSSNWNLPGNESRITRVARMIEEHPNLDHSLIFLAREARLSRFHFVRVFQQATGLTPHQYVLRARLRGAATRLALEPDRVIDIALESGFDDVSNFNRLFRTEFGTSPRLYRKALGLRLLTHATATHVRSCTLHQRLPRLQ